MTNATLTPEYRRAWRDRHPSSVAQSALAYRLKNPAKVLLWGARQRSRKKGWACNLTLDDIAIPNFCPVLGIPIFLDLDAKRVQRNKPNSPSLDRIHADMGYVKGNVRVISWRANDLKKNMTLEEARLVVADLERNDWSV